MSDKFVFFWGGPFSQWMYSPFERDGMTFVTAEQWMMYQKAIAMADAASAAKIMATEDPREQKALGRKVANYNDMKWMRVAYNVVVEGNLSKFSQNADCMEALKQSRGKIIVEASPYDKRWGIGMAEGAEGIEDPANWKGENLLGKAIMDVRTYLLGRDD